MIPFDFTSKIVKLSEGNPGAANALITVLQLSDDPDKIVNQLQQRGIVGWRIWVLWKDLSEYSTERFSELLFAPNDVEAQIERRG